MKKVVEQTACDRCGTQIAEGDVKQAGVDEEEPVLFSISGDIVSSTKGVKGGEISFTDLCVKCRNRIKSLIAAVMKSGKTGPKKPRTTRTRNSTKGKGDKDKGTNGATTTPPPETTEAPPPSV